MFAIMVLTGLSSCESKIVSNKDKKYNDDCGINETVIINKKGGTKQRYSEDFETGINISSCPWYLESLEDVDPFSESGVFFTRQKISAVKGYRKSFSFGDQGWLTAELYSRRHNKKIAELFQVVDDPSRKSNKVLRLKTPEHTDGMIIRSTWPLPTHYRLSLKVGFAQYGDGQSLLNGYNRGDERAEPWLKDSAITENGFYWLAILDVQPKPHNNIWIHHHRKFVIDSDNHNQGWMEIFNGKTFENSGTNPIMVFALDGKGKNQLLTGKPFISYANQMWQPSGAIRAVDAYLPEQWYQLTFTRSPQSYHFTISGIFKFGGATVYEGEINLEKACVWHYNRTGETLAENCIDHSFFENIGEGFPFWPADIGYPDYFMFGDPHINYYEGQVYYDDISLEIL